MSTPLPKVSASKYAPAAAKVIFRVKDSGTQGVLYQGQRVVTPCKNCPSPKPTP
jgi:hypothetical protein